MAVECFISHMVQMKARNLLAFTMYQIVFISHMVQMKALETLCPVSQHKLYIPHGSDERSIVSSIVSRLSLFISHMVQMKE